jgi:hypothetical protein
LRVALLHVTKSLNEHLDGDILVVGEEVLLRGISGKVDKRVGVRGDTSKTSEDVADNQLESYRRSAPRGLLVEKEDLLPTTTHPGFGTFTSHTLTSGR